MLTSFLPKPPVPSALPSNMRRALSQWATRNLSFAENQELRNLRELMRPHEKAIEAHFGARSLLTRLDQELAKRGL